MGVSMGVCINCQSAWLAFSMASDVIAIQRRETFSVIEIVLQVLERLPSENDIPITYWEFSIGESEGNWGSAFHNIRRKRIVSWYLFRLSASVALDDGEKKISFVHGNKNQGRVRKIVEGYLFNSYIP